VPAHQEKTGTHRKLAKSKNVETDGALSYELSKGEKIAINEELLVSFL